MVTAKKGSLGTKGTIKLGPNPPTISVGQRGPKATTRGNKHKGTK